MGSTLRGARRFCLLEMYTTVNIVDLFISKNVLGLVVYIYGILIALGSAAMYMWLISDVPSE